MNTLDNDIADKQKIHKSEITKRLYYLNYYIGKLKKQRNKYSDDILRGNLIFEINKFYRLKEQVLMKMVKEGYAGVRQIQISKYVCYCVIRVSREYTFHLPMSNKLKKVINENKKKGT